MPFTTINNLKLFLFFTLLGVTDVNAQTLGWAKRFAATSYSEGHCTAVDPSGNVYSAGKFNGTVDFDPNAGVVNLTSTPSFGAYYFSKLTSAGNHVWVKSINLLSVTYLRVYYMNVDPAGNVYYAGTFGGNIDIDPGPGTFTISAHPSYPEFFLLKLSSAGNFMWAVQFFTQQPNSVFNDAANNVYVVGTFTGTMDFDPGAGVSNLTAAGLDDAFITRYTAAGAFGWAKKMGGAGNDRGYGGGIDAAGNLYVSGSFAGTADFDPGAGVSNLTAASSAGYDAFVTKLNSTGNFTWARRMGGTASSTQATKVDIDGSGNVYLSGHFGGGTADFDPGAGVVNLTPTGANDIFISKLSSAGNYVWAKRIGGATAEVCTSMNVNSVGHVFTGGYFEGTVDFDPGAGTQNRTSAGNEDMFIMMLNASGNYGWAWTMGSAGDDFLIDLKLDGNNFIYSTGVYQNTVDFNGTSGTFNLTAANIREAFVHKINLPSPLPIELLTFNATPNKNTIDLTWATATETNNDFFTIEKSKDGNKFEDVAKVDGAGNSNQVIEYFFTDKNPYNGLSYYRLKQTDFNGEFSYSKTVAVNLNPNNQFYLYQNPSANHIIVAFKNAETQPCKLLIHDVTGRMVHEQQITSATTILNFAFLPGVYVASVKYSQQAFSQKFIVR